MENSSGNDWFDWKICLESVTHKNTVANGVDGGGFYVAKQSLIYQINEKSTLWSPLLSQGLSCTRLFLLQCRNIETSPSRSHVSCQRALQVHIPDGFWRTQVSALYWWWWWCETQESQPLLFWIVLAELLIWLLRRLLFPNCITQQNTCSFSMLSLLTFI